MSERQLQLSVSDYLKLGETVAPQELTWGRVRDAPSPAPPHQGAVLDFAFAWRKHTAGYRPGAVIISPMDCVLDRERALVIQPDLIFVSRERTSIITDRIWGAPDLVLEVLSPYPRIGTLTERLHWFAHYGVKECWLYHQPERALDVIGFENGAEASRRSFAFEDRIVSPLWPEFDSTCAAIRKPMF